MRYDYEFTFIGDLDDWLKEEVEKDDNRKRLTRTRI